jgi:hypothetical protein
MVCLLAILHHPTSIDSAAVKTVDEASNLEISRTGWLTIAS